MDLTGIPLSGLGWGGLIFLAVVFVIRGDLVPRKIYEAMVADRDYWRGACQEKDATIAAFSESARTTAAVLEALPKVSDSSAPGVASDAEERRA